MSALVLLAISTALSILFIPLAIKLAPHLGMVDLPDEARKVHVKPIPRVGGIGIALGALIPLTFMLPLDPLLQSFVIGALTLFLFGLWDDAKQLSHWVKFVGQFFAAGLIVYYGGLWVERFPFLDGPLPAAIGQPFTIIAIVGVINAINHSDGLDGLAGGESLLSLIVMGFLAYIVGDSFAVLLCSAVAGGILGFLRFNTHPAQIFMGDAGSQFLGFSLAFLAVYLTQVAHPALSPALPLLLIGLPIADINAVFYLRIKGGMHWFRASRNHIHHRLLDLGFDHYETVILIYFVQALLVGSAIFVRYESDLFVMLIFFGVVAVVFAGLTLGERRGVRLSDASQAAGLGRILGEIRVNTRLRRLPAQVVTWGLAAIILIGALSAENVPEEFGWISAVLLLLCLAGNARFMASMNPTIIRGALYAAALFVVYLTIHFPPDSLLAYAFSTPAFIVLAVVLSVAIRVASEDTFKTNPTDYLIILGIITIALFGRDQFGVKETSLLLIHSVIILYASELAFRESCGQRMLLRGATIVGLAVLLFRGLVPS